MNRNITQYIELQKGEKIAIQQPSSSLEGVNYIYRFIYNVGREKKI